MRLTTLFWTFTALFVTLVGVLGWLSLDSLARAEWWDERIRLAKQSYRLHLQLEANVFRLFKQHGDALLIGDRDGGEEETALKARIARNLADLREVIAREIDLAGEEEIGELALLGEIEADIRKINEAIASFTASGEPIDTAVRIERLAALLDGEIDVTLDQKIERALADEAEEVAGVLAEAARFRAFNRRLVLGILLASAVVLALAVPFFIRQVSRPVVRLREEIEALRQADYSRHIDLGGSREFRELSEVLTGMSANLVAREASRAEQEERLQSTVAARTAELQRLVNRLETGEENRKRLMADISHELRTPLAIIRGEADVTLRTVANLGDEVSDALARIRDAARHTNQIVDDLLTVARNEAGQLRLDRRETDLRHVVREAVAMFPGRVRMELPEAPVPEAVDAVRLRQAVLALLQNARRYGGPSIVVLVLDGAAERLIVVEDDGPGLSAAEKAQAFERFFRGSNAAGLAVEGAGLGLPVVRSIVEAHGGTVRLLDREAGGLRVEIALPRAPRIKVVAADAPRRIA